MLNKRAIWVSTASVASRPASRQSQKVKQKKGKSSSSQTVKKVLSTKQAEGGKPRSSRIAAQLGSIARLNIWRARLFFESNDRLCFHQLWKSYRKEPKACQTLSVYVRNWVTKRLWFGKGW